MQLAPGTSWAQTFERARLAAPVAFTSDRILNLIEGRWIQNGEVGDHRTPVDGTQIPGPPRIEHRAAELAAAGAVREHQWWAKVDLDERRRRVLSAVKAMAENRDPLAFLWCGRSQSRGGWPALTSTEC